MVLTFSLSTAAMAPISVWINNNFKCCRCKTTLKLTEREYSTYMCPCRIGMIHVNPTTGVVVAAGTDAIAVLEVESTPRPDIS